MPQRIALKRNLLESDSDSKSDSEESNEEVNSTLNKEVTKQSQKKIKYSVLDDIESDSQENPLPEEKILKQKFENLMSELNSSDENESAPLSYLNGSNKNHFDKSKNIQSSFISSDDEALTIETKKSPNKVKKLAKEVFSTDISEEPLSEISKCNRKSKRVLVSSEDSNSNYKPSIIKRKRISRSVQKATVALQTKGKRETSKPSVKFHKATKNISFDKNDLDTSEEEDEPISKILKSRGANEQVIVTFKSSEDEQAEMTKVFSFSETEKKKKQKFEQDTNKYLTSSDDDEPIINISKTEKCKMVSISSGESDNDPLGVTAKKSLKQVKRAKKIQKKTLASSENDSHASSDVEDYSKLTKQRKNCKRVSIPSSSSEDELEKIKRELSSIPSEFKENFKSRQEKNKSVTLSDEDETIKMTKIKKSKVSSISSNESNNEFLIKKSSKQVKNAKEIQRKKLNLNENSLNSSSDENKPINKVIDISKGKENSKKNASNARIEHLKKYLRTAGIRIQSYDALFKDCKSIKSKVEKMLNILHCKGLKGQPTLKKCKKLRKKIETKMEVAELDTSNIIKTEGRSKRSISHNISKTMQSNITSCAEKDFSYLKDIIDSEDSG